MLTMLVCALVAIFWPAPATASVRASEDSRLGLNAKIAEYTYRLTLREPRIASGNYGVAYDFASDPLLRWKARWHYAFGGTEVYDVRARQWSPELGAFLSIDNYDYRDGVGTLWTWPSQNPIRYRDPTGHIGMGDSQSSDRAIGSSQNWGDSDFRGALNNSAVIDLAVLAHFLSPLAFLLDAGLAVSSEKDLYKLPLLGATSLSSSSAGASCPIGTRGPASGPRVVSPPGPGQVLLGGNDNPMGAMVFEGHGTTAAGSLTVPQGTYLQLPNSLFVSEPAAQAAAIQGTYPAGQSFFVGPGGSAPNLVLHPPTPDLIVRPSSTIVTRPTLLGDILEPNMGVCVWGACR